MRMMKTEAKMRSKPRPLVMDATVADPPKAISVPIIIATQKLPSTPFIPHQLQRLIHIAPQIICIFRTDVTEGVEVGFDFGGW